MTIKPRLDGGYDVQLDPSDMAVLLAAFGNRSFQNAMREVLDALPSPAQRESPDV